MALVGCSTKECQTYEGFKIYDRPAPLKIKIITTKGDKVHIRTLENGVKKLVTKVKQQEAIIDRYEADVNKYLKWRQKQK